MDSSRIRTQDTAVQISIVKGLTTASSMIQLEVIRVIAVMSSQCFYVRHQTHFEATGIWVVPASYWSFEIRGN